MRKVNFKKEGALDSIKFCGKVSAGVGSREFIGCFDLDRRWDEVGKQ